MVLTRMSRFNLTGLVELYNRLGSATAVMEHRNNIRDIIPDASQHLVEALHDLGDAEKVAAAEMEYDQKHRIETITMNDSRYPQRLKECPDAPLILYFMGNADLNWRHVTNIVGTRHCTNYGRDLIEHFVRDLEQLCPDVLILSGLAYGIDICAHRTALACGFETVGILAHGLDTIYPRVHRDTAINMLDQGGLLTEYMTHTQPVARNFVQRNRLVAGCADATILVESAAKGGGLITCNIARSYDRDIFAFPGAIGAPYSEGCNNLIRDNGAALITSAADFVKAMGWDEDMVLKKTQDKGIQRELFPDLTDDEQAVVRCLQGTNDLQLNILTVQTGITVSRLTALLFELELKGIVKPLAGGMYHLIG